MRALMISADQFEDSELLVPYYRLREEGVDVDIATLKKGPIRGKHGYEVECNKSLTEINAGDYDLLVLPGGKAPAALRGEPAVQAIVRAFFLGRKPVAAICHGPQILASAGVLKNRHATCYKTVAPELKEAGARYEDQEVIVDDNLVTSRQPGDLPAFMRELTRKIGVRR